MISLLAFIPPYLLKTNVEDFKVEDRQLVSDALSITNLTLDNAVERLIIISYGVSLNEQDEPPVTAEVVAYTFFGIPYAVIEANEKGASVKTRFGFKQ
ncbi:hypothetical protein [Paenisporosarcina sp. NPDC076898]|uniref:hypothetical protein n=1 Tax=unclassified Paenisporosarcina TaxID=2642018 RepID=UPI003D008777